MSKIADAVFAKDLKQVRARADSTVDEFSVKEKFTEVVNFHSIRQKHYNIGLTIGTSVWINDYDYPGSSPKAENELHDAIYNSKRAIIEQVFGEFRPILMKLEREIFNGNKSEALGLVRELEKQMFTVGKNGL